VAIRSSKDSVRRCINRMRPTHCRNILFECDLKALASTRLEQASCRNVFIESQEAIMTRNLDARQRNEVGRTWNLTGRVRTKPRAKATPWSLAIGVAERAVEVSHVL
jgi:hypothetical protein